MRTLCDMWGTVYKLLIHMWGTVYKLQSHMWTQRKLALMQVWYQAIRHTLLSPLSKLLAGNSIQEDSMDLDSPQQGQDMLGDAPEEPEKASHGMFNCAICLEEHSMEDCYMASMCGHRMCRSAARKVVLGAVRSAPGLATLQR